MNIKRFRVVTAVLMTMALVTSLLAFAAPAAAVNGGVQTQLGIVLDGSGSISGSDWALIKSGLATAIQNNVPQDGSVELTVVQFSQVAVVEVGPVVVDGTTIGGIVTSINGIGQMGSVTAIGDGLNACAQAMFASSNFALARLQVINLATDGGENYGTPSSTVVPLITAAGIDEIDAEAIGGADTTFLLNVVAYPKPGVIATSGNFPPRMPPDNVLPTQGFVIVCADVQAYVDALNDKFQEVIPPLVPSMTEWGMITVAVLFIGLTVMAPRFAKAHK